MRSERGVSVLRSTVLSCLRGVDLRFVLLGVTIAAGVFLLQAYIDVEADLLNERAAIGKIVPPMELEDSEGRTVNLTFGPKPTVLYIFDSLCHWCSQNATAVNSLNDQLQGRYRFIGLSMNDQKLSEYLAESGQRLPESYSGVPEWLIHGYNIGRTPETIVITADGVIARRWVGAYSGPLGAELASFFGIDGVTEVENAACDSCATANLAGE